MHIHLRKSWSFRIFKWNADFQTFSCYCIRIQQGFYFPVNNSLFNMSQKKLFRRLLFICINYLRFLARSCWQAEVQFIFLLSQQRPTTVWLVTAGSGPHISRAQLPCRRVLTHTHSQASQKGKAGHMTSHEAEAFNHFVTWTVCMQKIFSVRC